MKLKTIIAVSYLFIQVSFAQTENYTINCPENTFLGVFSCEDVDDIPRFPGTIEEAMLPPYNIQIEGDIPPVLGVTTFDDNAIFFCSENSRIVTRKLIFYIDANFNPAPWEDPIAECSFTIETTVDTEPIEFIAPPDEVVRCNPFEAYPGEVTFTGDDCFAFDQTYAFFEDQIRVEEETTFVIRTWQTTDACGNLADEQQQIITIDCERNNNYTITCPENTFLGTFSCFNITEIPDQANTIEEVMAPPYNIQIEGDITNDIRAFTIDDSVIFYCESDARIVNRNVIIYKDINLNFAWDLGEEIGGCNYTIETERSPFPDFTAPPDIEIDCGVDPNPGNTGDFSDVETGCPVIDGYNIQFEDSTTTNGNIITITRTWQANILCDYLEKTQTITINCEPENDYTITCPENTVLGVFGCEDIDDIPQQINTIEEAMAPPYKIKIEGELPPTTQVQTKDNGIIFFCENAPRVVTREITFCSGYFGCGGFEPFEILGSCFFTIETIADISIPQFTAPPDIEILCDDDRGVENTGDVNEVEVNCFLADGFELFFSDTETIQGDITIINRTWMATNACGDTSTQIQTITVNCEPVCVPPVVGTFDCGN